MTSKNTTEIRKIVILYRSATTYRLSSVQSTVRFLNPMVPQELPWSKEAEEAYLWWEKLTETEREKLNLEYRFAAKIAA